MEFIKTEIEGLYIIEPKLIKDSRGYFFESYSKKEFDENIFPVNFVQDNESMSTKGVIRGLHFQKPPHAQSKLVRCVKGRVIDVALDIRKGSPTYGRHLAVELSENNHRQFFIPRGFAHGFVVLSDIAIFQYKCDNFYHPESEGGINILDNSLNIEWGVKISDSKLSEKDLHYPSFSMIDTPFDFNVDLY